jgi:hypothetical protein
MGAKNQSEAVRRADRWRAFALPGRPSGVTLAIMAAEPAIFRFLPKNRAKRRSDGHSCHWNDQTNGRMVVRGIGMTKSTPEWSFVPDE